MFCSHTETPKAIADNRFRIIDESDMSKEVKNFNILSQELFDQVIEELNPI